MSVTMALILTLRKVSDEQNTSELMPLRVAWNAQNFAYDIDYTGIKFWWSDSNVEKTQIKAHLWSDSRHNTQACKECACSH